MTVPKLKIRGLDPTEASVLDEMLYEVVWQPEGAEPLPRDIIRLPEINLYVVNFGKCRGDHCLVAETDAKIVGAVWTRILTGKTKGFGHVDDQTPELAIALQPEYRNCGIGTLLMRRMIDLLKEYGYAQISLSVSKNNDAVKLYRRLNFEIVRENSEDYVMVLNLES